jgi:mannosyltransferase OCH1-like enzyme
MSKILQNIVYEGKTKPQVITKINSAPFPNKNINEYNIQVPANIFQTWHTKQLPPMMFKAIELIKKNNPRFNYYLFDDNDCREFIRKNFRGEILNAYDSLIPGAYKADLWRYCVLYRCGGIYLDIKYIPVNGFKFINLLEQEHWPLDINKTNIYNALLVCKPGNEILFKAINQIVENVKNKYYGPCYLSPTGPELLSRFFSEDQKNTFPIYHELMGNNDSDKIIKFNNYIILRGYPGYIRERELYSKIAHYHILWNNKQIY